MHTQNSPESDRAGTARAGSMPSTHLQSLVVDIAVPVGSILHF